MELAGQRTAGEVGGGCSVGGRKPLKERHVVSWSQQEDDLLREQVEIHGIENWTSIAAQFKDKSGRQCRRRWFTYLYTECKKGGWSPEEDALLCEAQKIFGNRWTEIAKVVSGRTDNAVKNRFNTLCKKRMKQEAMAKENAGANGLARSISPASLSSFKKIRCQTTSLNEKQGNPSGDAMNAEGRRIPLAVLGQNRADVNVREIDNGERKTQSAFDRRDDPKLSALLQQAELLSSLAFKVHTDSTDRCLDSAWKELKDYLIQNGEREPERSESTQIDFLLDDFSDLMQELTSSSTKSSPFNRPADLLEEQPCLEVNEDAAPSITGRTFSQSEDSATRELPVDPIKVNSLPDPFMFDSPSQTIPIFSPFSTGIPSPNFSASERRFLLSVFGSSSSFRGHVSPTQKPPACKRALLDSL